MNKLFPLLLTVLLTWGVADAAELQDGDIIFQESRSSQSLAIQKATGSRYSHMGIEVKRIDQG